MGTMSRPSSMSESTSGRSASATPTPSMAASCTREALEKRGPRVASTPFAPAIASHSSQPGRSSSPGEESSWMSVCRRRSAALRSGGPRPSSFGLQTGT